MIPLRAAFLTIITIIEVLKVQALSENIVTEEDNKCLDPSVAHLLNIKLYRKNLPVNCRPPTPHCDYKTNQCVEIVARTRMEAESEENGEEPCTEYSLIHLLKIKRLRKFVPNACNTPTHYCDYKTNQCVLKYRSISNDSVLRQQGGNNCLEPSVAHLLEIEEYRNKLPLLCKPSTPDCDYERNQCIMKVDARNIEEPKLKQENMCVEPSSPYMLDNEKIRKYLPLNCKPPTPYCDYKLNQCVSMVSKLPNDEEVSKPLVESKEVRPKEQEVSKPSVESKEVRPKEQEVSKPPVESKEVAEEPINSSG